MRRRLLTGSVAAAALVPVASGPGASWGANVASGPLSPKVATAYVNAQASALCALQAKAYPTLAALHAAYALAQHSTHLTARQLAKARAAASANMALRKRISQRVDALCGERHTKKKTK